MAGGGELAKSTLQPGTLAFFARRDPLPHMSIQVPEVLFHLSKVREKSPCRVGELQESFAKLGRAHQGQPTGADLSDLRIEHLAATHELHEPHVGQVVGQFEIAAVRPVSE
jgi:hypothetical protein